MKTYKIFYEFFGRSIGYKDQQGFDIEVLSFAAAQQIISDLMLIGIPHYPPQKEYWEIVDSIGIRFNLE